METVRILIDLDPEIVRLIDSLAQESDRTRKATVQWLCKKALKDLNYKPQLGLNLK